MAAIKLLIVIAILSISASLAEAQLVIREERERKDRVERALKHMNKGDLWSAIYEFRRLEPLNSLEDENIRSLLAESYRRLGQKELNHESLNSALQCFEISLFYDSSNKESRDLDFPPFDGQ